MTALTLEVKASLRDLAGPVPNGGMRRAIERVARKTGFSYWRTFDLWYGKARRIDPAELDAIHAAKRGKKAEARHELLAIASGFEALAERLARVDEDMGGPEIERLRDVARRHRRLVEGERLT